MEIRVGLSNEEKEMKKLYESPFSDILTKPMTYMEYEALMEAHPNLPDFRPIYRQRGFQIQTFENTLTNGVVAVTPHGRYGYPIVHTHQYVEVIYVYSGKCMHYIEDKNFEMKKGDLCFVSPNATHVLVALEDDAYILNILLHRTVIDNDFLDMLRMQGILKNFFDSILHHQNISPYILFPTGDDKWMHDTLGLMQEEYLGKQFGFEQAILLYTKQMLLHIARKYQLTAVVAEPNQNEQDSNMVAFLAYLSTHFQNISLSEMANFFGYNETYLSRKLKLYTGKSFRELVTELQMGRAMELLKKGELSVSDIALEVGCFDSSHLTRKFKNYYGITPNQVER